MANVYMQQTTYPGLALHCGGYGLLFHEFDSKSPIVKLAYARRVYTNQDTAHVLVLHNQSNGKLIPLMKSIATDRQQAGKQTIGGSLLIVVGCGVFWWKAGDKVSARVLY